MFSNNLIKLNDIGIQWIIFFCCIFWYFCILSAYFTYISVIIYSGQKKNSKIYRLIRLSDDISLGHNSLNYELPKYFFIEQKLL